MRLWRLLILIIAFNVASVSLCVAAPVIGVVDDAKLAAVRSDYPALAAKVLPSIAVEKKLKIVVRQSGIEWMASSTQWVDITPDALAKLKRMNLAPLQAPSSTSVPAQVSTALTPTQQADVREAMRALRRMEAAVKTGIKFDAYSERIVDLTVTVEESLRDLPDGSLYNDLSAALRAYEDARTVWIQGDAEQYTDEYLTAVWPIFQRYGIKSNPPAPPLPDQPKNYKGPNALKLNPIYRLAWQEFPIQEIWRRASRHIENADRLTR